MIESYSFGVIVIAGKAYTSDIKMINSEVIPRWWRKTGHSVCIDDVADLLDANPKSLIIGKGSPGDMTANKLLQDRLKELEIELIEEPTAKAVEIFNQKLAKGENVAAGFHLTC